MKLKKILAATLVGAMVLTNVPVGNHGTAVAVAAENQEVTTSVTTGYELKEISQETLKSNASANSENANPTGNAKGGPAQWAFDNLDHWWHSHFDTGHPSASKPIYIQTGFGESKRIKKLTYTPRTDDKGGIIKNYEVKVSNVVAPSESDWKSVKTGVFENRMTLQEVVLDNAEDARWIRLVATSNYPKDRYGDFATAKKIQVFEEVPVQVEGVTLDQESADLKIGGTVTLTATVRPTNASQEVRWSSNAEEIATVENGVVTARKAGTAVITATSAMDSSKTATCTVVVTRDDSALDVAIEAAEAKMDEEGFVDKYTQESRKKFEDALELAYAAKADSTMSPEEVKLVVDELTEAIAGLEMKAVVTINNNGEEETKYCEVGEQVTVIAKQAPEGYKFSHWTVNDKPIAYGSIYTFTVYGDVNVASVYVETQVEVVPEATIMCTASYDKSTKIIKFTAKRSVPVGCKVIKHGMILTGNSAWDALYKNNPDSFVLGAERIITKTGKTTGLLGNYSASVKATSPSTWYAKGYVTYEDKNGEQKTVYSDLVQYEVK